MGGPVPRNCRFPFLPPARSSSPRPPPSARAARCNGWSSCATATGSASGSWILPHIGVAMDDDELERLKQLAGIRQGEVDRRAAADPVPAGAAGGDGHRSGAPGRDGTRELRVDLKRLEEEFGINLSLEKVYRMMDPLDATRIGRLQTRVGEASRALLPEPVAVLPPIAGVICGHVTLRRNMTFTMHATQQNFWSRLAGLPAIVVGRQTLTPMIQAKSMS